MSRDDKEITPSNGTGITPSPDNKQEPDSDVNDAVVEDSPPPDFERVLEQMPPKQRKIFSTMMHASFSGPMPNPLLEKFTPEHIDKFLDYTHEDEINAHSYRSSNRWFILFVLFLFLGTFIFLIVFLLPDYKDLLTDLLKLFVVFAGGFGGGYGFKSWIEKRRE